ncbi:MAG: D-Ala-D-Ala carboxypeptidase family metallohydrolase [Sphingomonas bacterium]|nr:D-Ala-D-Ala carboxypeptidase family metallohydrolase [Sphingomonas bacterium]
MRRLLPLLCLLLALPSATLAQPARFNPAADYITSGQDEPGYRAWLTAVPYRAMFVQGFDHYLTIYGVAGIVPTWQLMRTATDWQRCAADPFEVPPPSEWANLVETLRYIRAHVVPVVGPVEPVSVYRNPALNACAGGASESAHRHLFAVDMVPLRATDRNALIRGLCAIHAWQGSGFDVGMGFYKGLRFHVDSMRYRKWGADGRDGSTSCAATLAAIEAQAAASRAAIASRAAAVAAPDPRVSPDPLSAR